MSRRHFGNIRKLPSGRYQVRYRGSDGRMRPAPRTFTNKTDAQRWLTEIESQMINGRWTDPKSKERALGPYLDEWIEQRDVQDATRDLYRGLARMHIKPQLGGMAIGSITPEEVRRWHADRRRATGPQRLRQAYSLLRTVLATAVTDGLITQSPCTIKGAGSVKSPERPFMRKEDAVALIDALTPYMQTPALVTLLCHLRRGELLGLRRGDVDLAAGTLHVQRSVSRTADGLKTKTTKNGSARVAHLPPEALESLRSHLATHRALPSAPLFVDLKGQPLTMAHLQYHWNKARKKANLPQFKWHDMRHAGLTWFAMEGGTVRETMARGGHRSQAASLIYQHIATERLQSLAASLTLRPVPSQTVVSEA